MLTYHQNWFQVLESCPYFSLHNQLDLDNVIPFMCIIFNFFFFMKNPKTPLTSTSLYSAYTPTHSA